MNLGKFLLLHLVALLATATKTDTTFCSIGFSLLVDDVSFVPRYWQVNLGPVIWHYLVKKHFSNDYLIDVSMNKFWKTLTRGPKNGQFWPPLFVLFSILSVKNFAEKLVDYGRIQTQVVRVKGEDSDDHHSTVRWQGPWFRTTFKSNTSTDRSRAVSVVV